MNEKENQELALIYRFLDEFGEEALLYNDGRYAAQAHLNGKTFFGGGDTIKEAIEAFYAELESGE